MDRPNMRCYFGPLAPRAPVAISQTNMAKWREGGGAKAIISRGATEDERRVCTPEAE